MRRKSERTTSKKSKSPDKKEKLEKPKHTKTRRRKQSSSSASESADDIKPVETAGNETNTADPPKPEKDEISKESQDQVWQVKTTEGSGDVGEIQKLKLCLARPSSTPERVDRSPRSKRKHSRATSSSDTQSVEGEDKKKSKRRSKRNNESKDVEKNDENLGDDPEVKDVSALKPLDTPISNPNQEADQELNTITSTDDPPISTTIEETKCDKAEPTENENVEAKAEEDKTAESEDPQDTAESEEPKDTAESQKPKDTAESEETKDTTESEEPKNTAESEEPKDTAESEEPKDAVEPDNPSDGDTVIITVETEIEKDQKENVSLPNEDSPVRKRSLSTERSEILELHAEENRCESSEVSFNESQDAKSKTTLEQDDNVSKFVPSEVSINKNTTEISGQPESQNEDKLTVKGNDLDNPIIVDKKAELDSNQEVSANDSEIINVLEDNTEKNSQTHVEIPTSQTTEHVPNGETTPLVINRKRRWGSRPSKLTSQKSITISTDVLKEIIPDVKPAEFDEVIEEKKHKRIGVPERIERPILPKIIIDNTENLEIKKNENKIEDKDKENVKVKDSNLASIRKISIVKDHDSIISRPPSPPRHKQSNILYITNLVRPFTLPQLKNLLQRTGKIVDNGFWIDRIKSKCYVKYVSEDQAVETRHALHGVTWPVSNPKTLHVDFSTQEDFDKAKTNEDSDNAQVSTIPGTVEDWLREQDMKREKGELEKPWERKTVTREWDVGKNEKNKEINRHEKVHRDERPVEKRRHRTPDRSPEPARKFKKKEDEAPAKLLDDLFRKTKATPCIYWLPLSAETIAIKEEQRRQHMAEHERRLQELRRTHRRH